MRPLETEFRYQTHKSQKTLHIKGLMLAKELHLFRMKSLISGPHS